MNQLVIDSSGTIAFTVLDPDDSTSCTLHLIIVDAQKDRIYSLLLAAKSTNKPINVNFDNACKVTSIALP